MNLLKECQKVLNLGVSIRFLARKIGRDHTTLSKWLQGERNISTEVEQELIATLKELKAQWNDIQV